ncbi:uncharacterized protein LOC105696354 [Orussus abietinus]|uniref:uncharacterized protein LOC105696354 n=1 Tax=Orussus abietinus TaxID=222816 RepID=UPI00062682D5|nr:uncharacterized protein LOC105696354 [Orussus abietinus]
MDEDPLGFTKQTALLLKGLGCTDLIPQFKKRNISTTELSELDEEDFITLGADRELAEKLVTQFNIKYKRGESSELIAQHRLKELIEILRNGKQELSLLQALITFARLKLLKEQTDFFIDYDEPLRASQALSMAASATLLEIKDAEHKLCELAGYLDMNNESKRRYIYLSALISGIGVTVYIVMRVCNN